MSLWAGDLHGRALCGACRVQGAMSVSPLIAPTIMRIPAHKRPRVPLAAAFATLLLSPSAALSQGVAKIMPLGDSITWGAHRTETVPGGYRKELSDRLTASGIPFDFVGHGTGNPAAGVDPHHNGNNGIRTDQVLTNLQTWMTTNPDVVLMKLGTNDMLQKVPVHVAAENIRTLIHRITDNAPNRRLYVATIIPIVETRDGRTAAEWAPIVDAYNAEVRKLVAEHAAQGRKVRLAEVRNGITYTFPNSAENFFQPTDGTHPATAGYKQLGAYWFSTITASGSVYDPPAVGYPNVPTTLAATIASGTQVNLSWTDTSGNESGFKIYRKTGTNGAWAHVATAPANATGTSVTGLSTANTFYQFAVSATNGSGDSAWSRSSGTTPANVALNRTAVATSVFSSSHVAARGNDNNATTLWASATNDSAPAWRVDLAGNYQIHRVEIHFRQDSDQPAARRNFEIQGSNDPSFSSYQVLGSQGSTTLMHAATFGADVTNATAFSHIRMRKTDGGQFSFAEARVYGSPAGGQPNVVTLDVASSPQSGVSVTASPADRNGAAGGVTTFTRSYNKGASVTLTAPASSGSGSFVKWQLNGVDHSTNPTLAVTLNTNSTLTAVYGSGSVNASLVNGSFESGYTGWTQSGNHSIQTAAVYAPPNGSSVVAFNAANTTPNGVLAQTFATTAGTSYTVSFDMGTFSYNTLAQRLQFTINGSGNLLTRDLTMNGAGNRTARWARQTFTFVANSTSTTLTFRDTSTATNAIDFLLDHVRVIPGTGISDAPVATADSYSTTRDTVLTVPSPGVLANDTDPQGTALTAAINASPSHGSVTLNTNGSFTYTPVAGYTGTDSFTYHARDAALDSNIVTVTLTVNAPGSTTLANGGFESDFSGWTTSGNVAIGTAPTYIATEGAKLAFFNGANGTPNGVVSRAITTTPGQGYTLAFDVGVLSYNKSAQTLGVTATGSGTLLNQSIGLTGSGNGTIWQSRSYSFTANSTTTTLAFRDLSSATNSLDLLLDNVRLSGAAAAPAAGSTPVAARAAVLPDPSGAPAQPSFSLKEENITLSLYASVPGTYVLERSENLSRWEPVWTREVTEPGTLEFTEPKSAAEGNTFYRFGLLK
ncbi:MAG: DUF642 domain-containing protein [Verrucomicrobiaceae bacterium]|nr:MAG: DUF642 domain-containing protein [Verrucomicrobiaceae bacterium]